MNYYYDIKVNFQENNYMFYEWSNQDELEFIKKIPIFQVTEKAIKDLINHQIQMEDSFLELINDKTITEDKKLKYCALFVSKNGAIVLEFSDDGKSIMRSFLQIEDEYNVLEIIYTIPLSKIKYRILEILNYDKELRFEKETKRFILLEITTLYKNSQYDKLTFLYNEWFNENETNIDVMLQKMQDKLREELTKKELNIYNLIKLSYNNV